MGKKNKKGGKGRSNNEGKELAAKDERFATVLSNPIYKPVPKSEKKISIDKRFQSMFHVRGKSFDSNVALIYSSLPVPVG